MVFFPQRELVTDPKAFNLDFESLSIAVTETESVHAWFVTCSGDKSDCPVVLFSHGNAGNISNRLETALFLNGMGADLLMYDYRGYGQSDGKPDEAGCYQDVLACYRWLVDERNVSPERIVIFGRSLGGAVAADLATKVPCRSLIIESSFTSAEAMGKRMFPFMPIRLLLRYKFDALAKIPAIQCPVLICHSPDDEIVPFQMGRQIFDAAPQPRRFVTLSGGHNERGYFDDSLYREAVRVALFDAHSL